MAEELSFPSEEKLLAELSALAAKEQAVSLCISALQTGQFQHPDGRVDPLGLVRIALDEAGLVAHLAARCVTPLSIEIGFGMGSSAAIILGARRLAGKPFAHVIFDPYWLSDGSGKVVQSYLEGHFPKAFRRVMKPSAVGMAQLLDKHGPGIAGFIFIDGDHRFESVMIDFVLADQLCCEGGYILLDDALFPAIETVINYVKANRPDYAVAHLAARNCTVLKKIVPDQRSWDAFTPFEVPQRENWTRSV